MSDIFISYASEDRPRAEMLAEALERRGWSIFWDRTIPIAKTWRETIGLELKNARCVIVLWSKVSIESDWVQEEADDAKRRRVLVPILIENVQPPIGFRSIQAGDLAHWDGTESIQAFRRLITDITALIGPPPKEAGEEGKLAEAEVERKAEEQRKRAEAEPKRQRPDEREVHHLTPMLKYIALASAGAIFAAFIMTLNWWYWVHKGLDAFVTSFLVSSSYTLGLAAGLVLANRPPRTSRVLKLLKTGGGIVAGVGLCGGSLLALPEGYVKSFLSEKFPLVLLGWTTISLFVVVTVANLEGRWKDTQLNRFLWGGAGGVIGGAVWATSITFAFGRPFNTWLFLFAEGIALGSLVGFVESVAPVE